MNWSSLDWTLQDKELGTQIGKSASTVYRERIRLGKRKLHSSLVKHDQLLSEAKDWDWTLPVGTLAERSGKTRQWIYILGRKLGKYSIPILSDTPSKKSKLGKLKLKYIRARSRHGYTTKEAFKSGLHVTYGIWLGMLARCADKNNARYGGRGIRVCDRWKFFKNFLEDMGDRPSGLSIDRIDNNGNYCKDNCRWATQHIQVRNTSINVWVVVDGEKMIFSDAARKCNAPKSTLRKRLIIDNEYTSKTGQVVKYL